MAKGYWIARVDIHDPEAYKAYLAANGAVFRQFGARFLVRGGHSETGRGQRAAAQRDPRVPELRATPWPATARPSTSRSRPCAPSASEADIVIVEGYDGPQP